MKSYCLKCRKDTENINPRVSKTSNGRTMVLSKCAICGSKKSRFIKNQEAKGLLSNLGLRTPLSKVPILVDILFWIQFHWVQLNTISLQKTKKEFKNLKKQEIQTIFTKMNLMRLVYNTTWLMEILRFSKKSSFW